MHFLILYKVASHLRQKAIGGKDFAQFIHIDAKKIQT